LSAPVAFAYALRCVRAAPDRAFAVAAFAVASLEAIWVAWKLGRFFFL